jgi:hypothetical protein
VEIAVVAELDKVSNIYQNSYNPGVLACFVTHRGNQMLALVGLWFVGAVDAHPRLLN